MRRTVPWTNASAIDAAWLDTEDTHWAKLQLVVETARRIWG